ncbi:MAG: hypothetical protein ACOCTI_07675 [Phycisphaeraceae bacterium]
MNDKFRQDREEQALRERLARLSSRLVDTSRLERNLAPLWGEAERSPRWRRWRWPLQIAAAVAFLVLGGYFASTHDFAAGEPVVASPASLWQLHYSEPDRPMAEVETIDAAEGVIRRQWRDAPGLPRPERSRVIGCCLHKVGGRRVASVHLEYDGQPVTVLVGRARDFRHDHDHDGRRWREGRKHRHEARRDRWRERRMDRRGARDADGFRVHYRGEKTMVTTRRGARWICVMAEMPADQLKAFAIELLDRSPATLGGKS